jgi:hypothetical protein
MPDLVLVGGSASSRPGIGGHPWELFSWARGFRRLGFDVLVVDRLDRERCVFPEGAGPELEASVNLAYGRETAAFFGFEDRYAVVGSGGEDVHGPGHAEVAELAAEAVAFVNISGTVTSDAIKRASRLSIYVDTDPGLTQLWLASGRPAPRVEGHDLHFTIGENVGRPGCSLPTGGIGWRHTRQPVVLEDWPLHASAAADRFTTLATLRGTGPHGPLEELGVDPGHKIDELQKVIDLPRRVPVKLELAVRLGQARPEEVSVLEQHGWTVVDGSAVASDAASFREYVQASDGELSVQKGAFSTTASGWFSDRTTRYLASGKPAVVQDTGFTRSIPAGEGLFAFRTADDAVAAVERIAADYGRHSRAARELAEQHFDSDLVLSRFLEAAGIG